MARASDKRNRANRSNPGPNNQNNGNNQNSNPLGAGNLREVQEIGNIMADLGKVIANINKDLESQGKITEQVAGSFRKVASLSSQFAKTQQDAEAGGRRLAAAEKKANEARSVAVELAERAANASKEEVQALAQAAREADNLAEKMEAAVKAGQDKNRGGILFLQKKLDDFLDNFTTFEKISLGVGTAIAVMGKVFLDIDNRVSALAQNLNLSKTEANDLAQEALSLEQSIDYTTERLGAGLELMTKFASQTGIAALNLEVFNKDLANATRLLGISDEDSAALARNILAAGVSSREFLENALGSAQAFEAQNGLSFTQQEIMSEIAGSSAAFRANMGFSGSALGLAAAQARKLGLTLAQLEGASENLMNFEQSISDEMYAEVITGQQLNLERARMAALMGDMSTFAQEIGKQEAINTAFSTQNVIAQNAIASALGLSRDELAEIYTTQKLLTNARFESLDAAKDEYERLRKTEGVEAARRRLGSQELTALVERQSIMQKIENLFNNLKVILGEALLPIVDQFNNDLSNIVPTISQMINGIRSFAQAVSTTFNIFKGMYDIVAGIVELLVGIPATFIGEGIKLFGGGPTAIGDLGDNLMEGFGKRVGLLSDDPTKEKDSLLAKSMDNMTKAVDNLQKNGVAANMDGQKVSAGLQGGSFKNTGVSTY